MRRGYRKWYRKSRSYRKKDSPGLVLLAIILACVLLYRYWLLILLLGILVIVVVLLVSLLKKNQEDKERVAMEEMDNERIDLRMQQPNHQTGYSAKASLMTDCEKEFFKAFQKIVGSYYTVQPQINLASIIDKESQQRYRNELFRNIDFGIFDASYSLKLLIEINDSSHMQKERGVRDSKVRAICEEAGIPLITFWTKYGVNKPYIYNQLVKYLPLITAADSAINSKDEQNPDCQ